MTETLIIVNPVAGKMKIKNELYDLVGKLCSQGYVPTVRITSARGEATEIAEKEAGKYGLIICCGGDGTLKEVISGLIRSGEKPRLLYYACGSTNDFATTLGLPKKIDDLVADLDGRNTFDLDVGLLNGEVNFSYIASFGIFTKASYSAGQSVKNVLGHFAYLLEGAKELGDLGKSYHTKVTYDNGVIEGDYILVGATNSTSAGGVLRLSEDDVSLSDGLLEILLIKGLKNINDTAAIAGKLLKQQYDGENIILIHTRHAVIECEEAPAWTLDGECGGNIARAEIDCLKGAVKLVI